MRELFIRNVPKKHVKLIKLLVKALGEEVIKVKKQKKKPKQKAEPLVIDQLR